MAALTAMLMAGIPADSVRGEIYLDRHRDRLEAAIAGQSGSRPAVRDMSMNGVPVQGATWVDRRGFSAMRHAILDAVREEYERLGSPGPFDEAWVDRYLAMPRVVAGEGLFAVVKALDSTAGGAPAGGTETSEWFRVVLVTPEGTAGSRVWDLMGPFFDAAKGGIVGEPGEAPGDDPPGLVRPPSSQRIMTLEEHVQGRKHYTALYATSLSPHAALSDIVSRMTAQGFRVEQRIEDAAGGQAVLTGEQFMVTLSTARSPPGAAVVAQVTDGLPARVGSGQTTRRRSTVRGGQ